MKAITVRSHPHGCVSWNNRYIKDLGNWIVTPSRVCELKFWPSRKNKIFALCHTLTGVWVEICRHFLIVDIGISHTLTGVWVEIDCLYFVLKGNVSHPHGCVSWNDGSLLYSVTHCRHTLTGVWVEIPRTALHLLHMITIYSAPR